MLPFAVALAQSPVTFDVIPYGARVEVDGVEVCRAPCTPTLSDGQHAVTVWLRCFEPQSWTMNVPSSTAMVLELAVQEGCTGPVVVDAGRRRWKVWIDGHYVGRAPWEGELPLGQHPVRVGPEVRAPRGRSLFPRPDTSWRSGTIEVTDWGGGAFYAWPRRAEVSVESRGAAASEAARRMRLESIERLDGMHWSTHPNADMIRRLAELHEEEARWLESRGEDGSVHADKALRLNRGVMALAPRTRSSDAVMFAIAGRLEARGELREAANWYRWMAGSWPRSPLVPEARARMADLATLDR